MNYGQLKQEIVGLGFSDMSELEDFGDIVPDSINRAITEINMTICPIIGTYEFEQDGSEDDVLYYDMEELTTEAGENVFLGFAETPVMYGDKFFKKFNDYDIEMEKILVIDGSIEGKFKVYYKKAHTAFTTNSTDFDEIELPLKAHILVPLLSAYYIWLEDEKSKAVDYYNQYEKLAQSILADKDKPRVRILSGGI